MRTIPGFMAFSIIITTMAPIAGSAQSANGIHFYILKLEGNTFIPVDPRRAMMAGDKIKISFESVSEGYVYVVNIKPSGSRTAVFPNVQEPDNQTRSAQRYDLPRMGGFIVGQQEGTEVFQVLLTKARVQFLDEAIKERKGLLRDAWTGSNAAAELTDPKRSLESQGGESADPESRASAEQLQGIKRSLAELSLEVDTRIENIEARLAQISTNVELLRRKLEELSNNKPMGASSRKLPSRNASKKQSQGERNKSSAPKFLDPTTGGEVIPGEKEAGGFVSLRIPDSRLNAGEGAVFEIRLKVLDSQRFVRQR